MHLLELQEDSSVAKYCVKIAQHLASVQDYEVRGDGWRVGCFQPQLLRIQKIRPVEKEKGEKKREMWGNYTGKSRS